MLRHILEILTIAIVAVLAVVTPARSQDITTAEVDKAIDNAVKFLLSTQLADGGWAEVVGYPHGVSGLVTLSLLNAGLDPDSPAVSRALRHLAELELEQVYTVSLQTMVFCAANPNRYAQQLERNAKWLVEAQMQHGGWTYAKANGGGDPSNSQFALLALHEAQRAGVKLPDETWKLVFSRARDYWFNLQNRDGSFSYSNMDTFGGRGSMTCAGIASLVIVGSQLDQLEASVEGENILCCGLEHERESRIRAGLNWMAREFSVTRHPNYESNYHLYYIYALERAGRMTGQRFIGEHDWYREGAEYIVRVMQQPVTGSIVAAAQGGGTESTETAFGLLFLAKGKRQIVISRLKYGPEEDWNHHATAVQNLTAHTEQAWKRDLAWQTIDLSRASVADLLESPVLFISGSQAPNFSDAEKERLKQYVEQGGFIFAEGSMGNGCNGREFEQYFGRLVVELFDQPLEKLPPDHAIWFAETKISPSDLPPNCWLYGVQTCCRLGVVYVPTSVTCRWELNLPYGVDLNFPPVVQGELDNVTRLGINVLAYATGKELKDKLDAVTILEDVIHETKTDRGLFVLPVLRHNAGFDDAPRAVPNLIEWLDKENPFQMSSEKRLININSAELQKYPVVFMHGRGELEFNNAQREALRDYLHNGGFILADSICADEQFTDSFRRELELILGDNLEQLPETHPLLSDDYYGFNIREVQIINPGQAGDRIVSMQRKGTPILEVGRVEGRIAVVFSPLDMSCALESRHSLQCRGYVRQDAARIGINVLLFALQN